MDHFFNFSNTTLVVAAPSTPLPAASNSEGFTTEPPQAIRDVENVAEEEQVGVKKLGQENFVNADVGVQKIDEMIFKSSEFNKLVSPLHAINLSVALRYDQLLELDEKNQIMTSNVVIILRYADLRLRWKEKLEKFNASVPYIIVDESIIWRPNIYLVNGMQTMGETTRLVNARVNEDGFIDLKYYFILSTGCNLAIGGFPFDTQKCSIGIDVIAYWNTNLLIKSASGSKTKKYRENSEWHMDGNLRVKKFKLGEAEDSPISVEYELTLSRRSMYYVFYIFLPSVCITLVSFLQFMLPADGGEKASFGVTCLLSMTVFMIVLLGELSPDEKELPFLGVYIGFMILNISSSTFCSGIVIMVYHWIDAEGAPGCCSHIVVCLAYPCRPCSTCRRRRKNSSATGGEVDKDGYKNKSYEDSADQQRKRLSNSNSVAAGGGGDTTSADDTASKSNVVPAAPENSNEVGLEVEPADTDDNAMSSVSVADGSSSRQADANGPTLTWKLVGNALNRLFFLANFVFFIGYAVFVFWNKAESVLNQLSPLADQVQID